MDMLGSISWRRFVTLIRGLAPSSATAAALSAEKYIGGERVNEMKTPEQSQRAFEAIFSGARKN